MSVPWKQLHKQPVEILIESVNILLTPKGRNEWTDDQKTLYTNVDLRKKFLDEFTKQIFNDLIKAKEVAETQ